MVTDEVVDGLWYVAAQRGEEDRARREPELLLPGTAHPYVGTPTFRDLTGPGGERVTTRNRVSCCMFYTVRPEETCATCPRTCDSPRVTKPTAAAAS